MQRAGRTMSMLLLACLLAACSVTDGAEKRDTGTNPPAQLAEVAPPGDGSPSTTEEGDVTSRRVVPDPCLNSPDMNCRTRLNQLREINTQPQNQPTGLMVPAPPQAPPPPSNGGQCVIDITGQMNDSVTSQGTTTVTSITYRHTEIQRWEVSGPPMQVAGIVGKVYAMTWSTTGNGSKDQTTSSTASSGQSHTQRNLTVWNIKNVAGPLSTRLTVWLRPSDNRWVINRANLPNVPLVALLTDQQQQTIDGVVDQNVRTLTGQWSEFSASFYNWTEAGNLTQVMNKVQSFPVGVANGYAQIAPPPGKGSLTGGAQCIWNLSLVP